MVSRNKVEAQVDEPVLGDSVDSASILRILVITPFEDSEWQWLSAYFSDSEYSWKFINGNLFGKKQPNWAMMGWRATRSAANFDLVVSHHPYMTLWVAASLRIRGITTPHIAFSFNHGNKRFFTGPLLLLAKWALAKVELFNVFSKGERFIFNKLYGIPLCKLRFSHWAVESPRLSGTLPAEYADFQPYICAMGRNNRDFLTLVAATESLAINLIIVCSKRDAPELATRGNIKVISDITLDESMEILNGSIFSVVPLRDNSTGAGHMTFVHAMHLGKPQVVTAVENTQDYFFDNVHGINVRPNDASAMREAIECLLREADTRAGCSEAARAFAKRWLSEAAAARSAQEVIRAWAHDKPYGLEPDGWSSYLKSTKSDTRSVRHSP